MQKTNINWNFVYLISYIIFILILYLVYNLLFSPDILLDNTPENSSLILNNENNIPKSYLSKRSQAKSWIFWQMFVKNSENYVPFNEFKSVWNDTYSFKYAFKTEIKSILENPINYVKIRHECKSYRLQQEWKILEAYYNSKR